jgi:prolyl 3-hydroxylase /prolyl 3,4-dihydroxylase
VSDSLLRNVRSEIQDHLSFSPKETDIYKIHQSGDLASLDGLDDDSLALLPALLKLRDALYSAPFREYLSYVTGAGYLSGRKTDMAINVYTPGCHLLCHDDVIGSRRVSYILYLTDPDQPWREEWGGALRLYSTTLAEQKDGKTIRVPSPDHSVSIPPAFNQLSFFAVQPGESFHDVEEVYHGPQGKGRVRMAISGWYHIPQEGEEGYEEGEEVTLAEKSSLAQLQGSADKFDLPQSHPVPCNRTTGPEDGEEEDANELRLTEADLDHLLTYMNPSYLTPDAAEELEERFGEDSSLILDRILGDKFVERVKTYIDEQGKSTLPKHSRQIEESTSWRVARPPHKHRYLFQSPSQGPSSSETKDISPIQEILFDFLASTSFQKWLRLITGCPRLLEQDLIARRFRKGQDYQLATNYDGDNPRLEFTLGISPGWESENGGDDSEDDSSIERVNPRNDNENGNQVAPEEFGGYEVYMGGDDDEEDEEASRVFGETQATSSNRPKKGKDDPAIYRSATDQDDDGILLTVPASWNKLSIVLRDKGTMKFVKYVSKEAPSDRWDITGAITVDPHGWVAEE